MKKNSEELNELCLRDGIVWISEIGELTPDVADFIKKNITKLISKEFFLEFENSIKGSLDIKEYVLTLVGPPSEIRLIFYPKSKKTSVRELEGDVILSKVIEFIKVDTSGVETWLASSPFLEKIELRGRLKPNSFFEYEAISSGVDKIKAFFGEKAIGIVAAGMATAMSISVANVNSYIELKNEELSLSNKSLVIKTKGLDSGFIDSCISYLGKTDLASKKSRELKNRIVDYVNRYSEFISNSKLIESGIGVNDLSGGLGGISNKIGAILDPNSEIDDKFIKSISESVHREAERTNIDYKIFLSIIKVESGFKQDAVSSTGDYSLAQINFRNWNRERNRLGLPLMELSKLKEDPDYAIRMMAEILSILKNRHEKKDRLWFARYHSGTYSKKKGYANKLSKVSKKISSEEVDSFVGDSKKLLSKIDEILSDNPDPNLESIKSKISSKILYVMTGVSGRAGVKTVDLR